MFLYCNKFEETMLWKNSRVSLETLFDAILQQHPRSEEKSFKKFARVSGIMVICSGITDCGKSEQNRACCYYLLVVKLVVKGMGYY